MNLKAKFNKYNKAKFTDLFFQFDLSQWDSDERDKEKLLRIETYLKSYRQKLKPALISDAYFLELEHSKIRRNLNAIGKVSFKNQSKDQYFKTPNQLIEQISELFASAEQFQEMVSSAAEGAQLIANTQFKIDTGKLHLPEYEMKPEEKKQFETNLELFWHLIETNLQSKIIDKGIDPEPYLERIEAEANVIINSIVDQLNEFSYSLGAGGVMSGSVNVITLNMNRFIQNILNTEEYDEARHFPIIEEALTKQVALMHKYQIGHRKLFDYFKANKMLPANNAGYIDFDKQFLTIGLNGLLEGAEYLGYTPNNNSTYKSFIGNIHEVIGKENKRGNKLYGYKFNTEIVPAESLGVKFATWDQKDDYIVPRDCYNSYLYRVEDEELTILDKFTLHGSETTSKLDGGSACHLNLEDTPSKETCDKLLDIAVITGCPYFCINVKVTICNVCNHIDKHTNRACVKCGSTDIDYATRIIG